MPDSEECCSKPDIFIFTFLSLTICKEFLNVKPYSTLKEKVFKHLNWKAVCFQLWKIYFFQQNLSKCFNFVCSQRNKQANNFSQMSERRNFSLILDQISNSNLKSWDNCRLKVKIIRSWCFKNSPNLLKTLFYSTRINSHLY